jgi:hypothetical protein
MEPEKIGALKGIAWQVRQPEIATQSVKADFLSRIGRGIS